MGNQCTCGRKHNAYNVIEWEGIVGLPVPIPWHRSYVDDKLKTFVNEWWAPKGCTGCWSLTHFEQGYIELLVKRWSIAK